MSSVVSIHESQTKTNMCVMLTRCVFRLHQQKNFHFTENQVKLLEFYDETFSLLQSSLEIKFLHGKNFSSGAQIYVSDGVTEIKFLLLFCCEKLKLHKFPLTKIIVKCVFVREREKERASSFAVCTDVV